MGKFSLHIKGDKVIWAVAFLLALVSLLAVYSSTGVLAYYQRGGNTEFYLMKHFILLAVGFFLMYFTHKMDYRWFSWLGEIGLYVTIPLLIYTLFFGITKNEANRWITIPIIGSTFQPSDLARLTLIIFLARKLTKNPEEIRDFKKGFLPVIAWITLICGLIAPANLSTAVILFLTCIVIMVFGKIHLAHIFSLILIGAVGATLLFFFGSRRETYKTRIENFINQENQGYQVEQAKIAIASGGITGKGPGKSEQRNFLPQPYNDFIYAIIVEEYGLIGAVVLIILYLILLFRGIGITTLISDKPFGALLASGLTFSLVFQALIHMGITVNILPATGISLPMVSMGGTSIVFTCVTFGIILSVSREPMERIEEQIQNGNSNAIQKTNGIEGENISLKKVEQ